MKKVVIAGVILVLVVIIGSCLFLFLLHGDGESVNPQVARRLKTGNVSQEDFAKICIEGTVEQVKVAIANGNVDVNAQSGPNGMPPLMWAAGNNDPEIIKVLLQAGANINGKDKDYKRGALVGTVNTGNPEMVTALVKAGIEIEARDTEPGCERTPLMWVVWNRKNPQVVTELIRCGADVNAKGCNDLTPLMWAVGYNCLPDVVDILIQAKADVNAKDKMGHTALMSAVTHKNPEVIVKLIQAGADVNARSKDGKSALDYARENKNPQVVAELINAGAK